MYFSKLGDRVKAAAESGVPMLFAGNAMELLGKSITDDAGKVYEGLGLADFTVVQNKKRFVEDVYGHTDLYEDAVVGFVNRCSVITGVETPLLASMDMGHGNEGPAARRDITRAASLQPAYRADSGEKPGTAEGHGAGHLLPSGRDLPRDPGRSIHGRGLGHHSGAAESPLPEISGKIRKKHGVSPCFFVS